jgi:hypothetical protein
MVKEVFITTVRRYGLLDLLFDGFQVEACGGAGAPLRLRSSEITDAGALGHIFNSVESGT